MRKLKINPIVQQHIERLTSDFHQSMKDEGLDTRLTSISFKSSDCDNMQCPCGCKAILDPTTGNIIGHECERCE